MKEFFIYGLVDPDTKEIRYIGKTNNLRQRLAEHCNPNHLKTHTHKILWIKSLLSNDKRPDIEIIERVTIDNWQERERFWISFYKESLTNTKDGGAGQSMRGDDAIKRILEGHPLGKSGYRGVYWDEKNGRWRARIHGKNRKDLGLFDNIVDAAHAYDNEAMKIYGNNAPLNFPDDIRQIEKPNREIGKNNKSGAKGIFQTNPNTWIAFININKKRYHIGSYRTKEEAIKARDSFVKEVLSS